MTRFDDPRETRMIVISQRLHLHDLASRLLEQGRYDHLNLSSIIDRELVLPTYGGAAVRFRPGDLLSPTRFPQAELDRLSEEMGEVAFSAQYLQTPVPGDGAIVNLSRLKRVDEPFAASELDYTVMSIDPAVRTGPHNDFTAITVFGRSNGLWCLLDLLERRLDFTGLKEAAIGLAEKWRPDRTLIEGCHTGDALISDFPADRFPVRRQKPDGSKADRLAVACGRFYSGALLFPRNPAWAERVFAQFRSFPDGHDDIVDSITQFIAWLRTADMDALVARKEGRRPPAKPRPSGLRR